MPKPWQVIKSSGMPRISRVERPAPFLRHRPAANTYFWGLHVGPYSRAPKMMTGGQSNPTAHSWITDLLRTPGAAVFSLFWAGGGKNERGQTQDMQAMDPSRSGGRPGPQSGMASLSFPANRYQVLKDKLQQLKESCPPPSSEDQTLQLAEDLLLTTFDFVQLNIQLESDQVIELEDLVEACIDHLEYCIFYQCNYFDVDLGPKYLKLRSGIEYLVQNFNSFRVQYNDEDSDLNEYIRVFDKCLENWKQNYGSCSFYENIIHTPDELNRPLGVPSNHRWWFTLK